MNEIRTGLWRFLVESAAFSVLEASFDGFWLLSNSNRSNPKPTSLKIKPPPNAVPFSDEWLAAIEAAGEALVEQIHLYKLLKGHNGCVNAVEFNSTGELLVSGSDDKQVKFWDWNNGKSEYTYDSGHMDNIFQTKIMPFSDDRKIVTSGADGQVSFQIVY